MAVYGYTRTINTQNPEKRTAPQVIQIEEFCHKNKLEFSGAFGDTCSGMAYCDGRNGIERLCLELEAGDIVVVTDFSRFTRDHEDLCRFLVRLHGLGVTVRLASIDY